MSAISLCDGADRVIHPLDEQRLRIGQVTCHMERQILALAAAERVIARDKPASPARRRPACRLGDEISFGPRLRLVP